MARKSVSVDGGDLSVAREVGAVGRGDLQKLTKGTKNCGKQRSVAAKVLKQSTDVVFSCLIWLNLA